MELTLKDILHTLKNGIVIIIVVSILCMAGLGAYTYFFVKPEYTATARMYVYVEDSEQNMSISANNVAVSKSLVDTVLVILESKPVLEQVKEELAKKNSDFYSKVSIKQLRTALDGEPVNKSETITLTATTTSAVASAEILNALVDVAPSGIKNVIKSASVETIERADVPTKANWPVVRNAILGLLLGAAVTIIFLIFKSMIDNVLHGYGDLSKRFEYPALGVVPQNENAIKGVSARQRNSRTVAHAVFGGKFLIDEDTPFPIIEAYKAARTNVFYLPIEDRCKKLAFTSAISGEGKSINSVNLAVLLAQAGKKVLLIDADMRKPKVKAYLGLSNETGLSEYLAGIVDAPEIRKSEKYGFDVISSGKSSKSSVELLVTSRMPALIKSMEEKYDYIIIDTPPVNLVTDAVAISDLVSGYILSVRADYTRIDEMNKVLESIKQVNGRVFGFMLVGINPKTDTYGKYYSNYTNYSNSYKNYSEYTDDVK